MVTTSIPVAYSRTPGSIRVPAPRLGEHTADVLGQLGYADGEIAGMSR